MPIRRWQKRWTSAAARRIIEESRDARTVEEAVYVVASRLLEGVPCPPTDLEALTKRLNVTSVEPVSRLPISGELRKRGDGFAIVYSSSLSPARRRFTVAHELGHAVFEGTGRNCPRHGRELETICDMLAAEFLMPRDLFLARASRNADPEDVLGLARDFGTSVMATALRCQQLLGLSVFQIEDARLSWGYGAIRRHGDLSGDVDGFRRAITQAMRGEVGGHMVFVKRRPWRLRWVCLRGRPPRAVFVLQAGNAAKDGGVHGVSRAERKL